MTDLVKSALNAMGIQVSGNETASFWLFSQTYGFTIVVAILSLLVLLVLIHTHSFGKMSSYIKHNLNRPKWHQPKLPKPVHRQPVKKHVEAKPKHEDKKPPKSLKFNLSSLKFDLPSFFKPKAPTSFKAVHGKYPNWPNGNSNDEIVQRGKISVGIAKKLGAEKGDFRVADVVKGICETYGIDRKLAHKLNFEVKTHVIESHDFDSFTKEGSIHFKPKKR